MEKIREAMELALKEQWSQPGESATPDTPDAARPFTPVRHAAARAGAAAVVPAPSHRPRRPAERQRTHEAPAQRTPEAAAPSTPRASTRCTLSEEALLASRLVAAIAHHPARETYCLLQAAVLDRLSDNDTPWIGVTGPRSGRGKTLTAANLAISLAADAGRKILLIDLELRDPGVHRIFNVDPDKTLEDCLFGRAQLDEVLVEGPIGGLTLLPAGKAGGSAEQILTSPNLKKLLGELKEQFPEHVVVIDLPVLDGGPEAAALKTLVDGVLIVVEDGISREADYRRTLTSVGKARLIGTVLNRTEQSA